MHKKTKGTIAEMIVASRLLEEGWRVLFPSEEHCRYDLVPEKNGKFVRVQVKYVTPKNGALEINCRSSNNWSVLHYTPEEIDVLAAYNPSDRSVYFIPVKSINRSSLKLRLQTARNNQKSRIRMAKDFTELNF